MDEVKLTKRKAISDQASRAFKRRKRKEFNEAFRAIHKLLIGAAYMPSGQETGFYIGDTYSKMKKAKKELQKWWADA